LFVGLAGHPSAHHLAKAQVVHVADEDLLVRLHALNEQALEQPAEHQLELVLGIERGRLAQTIVPNRRLEDLSEEERIGLVEVGSEALVDGIDQLRGRRPVVNPLSSWKT
jgi:hypothetical protein